MTRATGRGAISAKFEVLGAPTAWCGVKADPTPSAECGRRPSSVVQRLPPGVAIDDAPPGQRALDAAVSVYEVHLGSWRRDGEGRPLAS